MRCCSYEGHVGRYSFSEHFHREIFREYGRFFARRAGWNVLHLKLMRKTEKTIPLTVFAMLFILGISVGSNNLIVSNLGRFSGQAALLACFSVLGSIIAAWLVYYLFFRKGGE